jgi:hypothetical protein
VAEAKDTTERILAGSRSVSSASTGSGGVRRSPRPEPVGNKEIDSMKSNIGKAERVVRVAVGTIVLSQAVAGPHSAWGYLGLLPLLTGLAGWCPPYALLGVSTARASSR